MVICNVRQGVGQPRVIGYVLGRLEDKDTFPPTVYRDPRSRSPPSPPSTPTGHVTSLAVLPGYRRCGVAGQLMSTLHEQASSIPGMLVLIIYKKSCMRGLLYSINE